MNDSVKKMWKSYLKSINEDPKEPKLKYESWKFETSENASNTLARLVMDGKKKGSSSTKDNFENVGEVIPMVGDLYIITNWNDIAQFIIQTTTVNIVPYKEVSEEFARAEGEGDLSLKYWQEIHEPIFKIEQANCGKEFSENTKIVCEEFEVIFKYS